MPGETVFLVVAMIASGMANSIANKYLVSGLKIRSKFFILFVQTLVMVCVLLVVAVARFGKDSIPDILRIKDWFYVSISLIVMIYSGLQANAHMSISLFTVLKNGTLPIIALNDWLYAGYRITYLSVLSFVLIVLSSVIGTLSEASSGDADESAKKKEERRPTTTAIGLVWMIINCLSSAAYSLRMNRIIKAQKISSILASLYINILALPFLTVFAGAEMVSVNLPRKHMVAIVFSGVLTFTISVTNAWASIIFPTTTIAMINALNKVPIAISGVLFRLEEVGSALKWVSVGIGMLSAIFYILSRQQSSFVLFPRPSS
ncbi:GDP-mannose transporter [Nematocida sp. AWRm80]|nr:GDP-mannose transporter [Nematocida sp. AWRm80]